MGGNPGLDNGDAFMRAQRAAQQQAINRYQAFGPHDPGMYGPISQRPVDERKPTPGEKPEPEDTTGLRMLEELLAKRRKDHGDER